MLKWVRQEDAKGCGLACIAMITGKTYAEIKAMVKPSYYEVGASLVYNLDGLLSDLGYAYAPKYPVAHYCTVAGEDSTWPRRDPWPSEPFADVHLVEVHCHGAPCGHFIVMLRDGTIYDPDTQEPRKLTDYASVDSMIAVVPIPKEGESNA